MSPLEDWRGGEGLGGVEREEFYGFRRRISEKAPKDVLVYGEMYWRPPAVGIFDRLQVGPPARISGVLRYRATWERGGTSTTVAQAIDFEGDRPALAEIVLLVELARRAVASLTS